MWTSGRDDIKTQVRKAFVMFLGIEEYIPNYLPNIDDIIDDETYFKNVFEKTFNYRFITNGAYNKTWDKLAVLEWIQSIRDKELLHYGQCQYDALIFCGVSHGSYASMICSDGEPLRFPD
eukprot:282062_1